MDKKVSVVIPVYNVEDYLAECVDSVLAQDYSNIEIILVDDGATDNSGKMCDDYKSKNANIVVVHKVNGGLSSARNAGTEVATGDYIAFLDSDDWISKDYISYQMKLVEKYNADIVAVRHQAVWNDRAPEAIDYSSEKLFCYDREKALDAMLYGYDINVSACKLFRADIAKRHPFPIGVLYEDCGNTYTMFNEADVVVSSSLPMYFYRRRSGSIVHNTFDSRHLVLLEHVNRIYDFILKEYPSLSQSAGYRCALATTMIAPLVLDAHDKETFKILQTELKKHYQDLAKNPRARRDIKIRGFALKSGYGMANAEYKIEKFLKKLNGKTMYK